MTKAQKTAELPVNLNGLGPLTGQSGKFLTNNGTSVNWGTVTPPSVVRSVRTSNTILGSADSTTLIDITSGTFTQTFTAAATLGSGWYCWIKNSGTGNITLDPNASELIDGLTSYVMYPGECRLVQCDGTGFTTVVVTGFSARFTTTFTMTKPPGYNSFLVSTLGGGGGGGSGGVMSALGTRSGGAGGGGGARRATTLIAASDLPASYSVAVGAGGIGGAAVSGVSSGNSGTAGGSSNVGGLIDAQGGGGGSAGSGGQNSGGSGGGVTGPPSWMVTSQPAISFVGGTGINGTAGQGAEWGGASGGGGRDDDTGGRNGASSIFGGGSGGSGGGFGVGPLYSAGGVGLSGGGNGGASSNGPATAGTNASGVGCGGGGGGACGNGGTSGKGGDGTSGFVIMAGEA